MVGSRTDRPFLLFLVFRDCSLLAWYSLLGKLCTSKESTLTEINVHLGWGRGKGKPSCVRASSSGMGWEVGAAPTKPAGSKYLSDQNRGRESLLLKSTSIEIFVVNAGKHPHRRQKSSRAEIRVDIEITGRWAIGRAPPSSSPFPRWRPWPSGDRNQHLLQK